MLMFHKFSYEDQEYSIPVYQFEAVKPGPTIFISGGIHGDEVNGIFAVRTFLERFNPESLKKGKLIVLPILNQWGFKYVQRRNPIDDKDINRSFGIGSERPTFSESYTQWLIDNFLSQCDYGIDFHDSGGSNHLIPHVRIHLDDKDYCVSCTREMSRIFGTKYILERKGSKNMMAVHMNNTFNTPVLTIEIGGGQVIYPETLEISCQGINNFLIVNGMLDGEYILPKTQMFSENRLIIKSKIPGIVVMDKELGDSVSEDEVIGNIFNPITQRTVAIKAPLEGILFSLRANNQVGVGQSVGSIMSFEAMESGFEKSEYLMNFQVENFTS